MAELNYIKKKTSKQNETGFEALKKTGLNIIQELSGDLWTDYNSHDPGVTILEQLIYGLTELIYQTTFDTADYLTSEDGRIDYEKLALFSPEEIFPSRALTVNDYRKIIFNAVPEIDNVKIKKAQNGGIKCLYQIDIALKEKNDGKWNDEEKEIVKAKVKDIYCKSRNVCEDLAHAYILENEYYTIHAKVETDNSRHPSEILSEIYFSCSGFISTGISFHAFHEMKNKGMALEEIFSGPFTGFGYIDEEDLAINRDIVRVSDITGIINSIDGVLSVTGIHFEKDGEKFSRSILKKDINSAITLDFPDNEEEVFVKLLPGGRKYKTDYNELRSKYEKLYFEHRVLRHTPQNLTEIYSLPEGQNRNYKNYYSIQNHFPALYGIGAYGIPASKSVEKKAKAKQLKGYIFLFEQLMANYLAGIEKIPDLFSAEKKIAETVSFNLLSNKNIPEIESLYKEKEAFEREKKFKKITRKYDDFDDRRNRMLDYLLAIYGEKFTQKSLRHYNYYYKSVRLKRELINNKINLLKNLVKISRDKAGGFNYREKAWNTDNISGVHLKTGILLGLKNRSCGSLIAKFDEDKIKLVSDHKLEEIKKKHRELESKFRGNLDRHIRKVFCKIPYLKISSDITKESQEQLFKDIICLKNGVINESLLRFGVNIEKFRVGRYSTGKTWYVFFRAYDYEKWEFISQYQDKKTAFESINLLRRYLVILNISSEGIHFVEHTLLRPQTPDYHDNTAKMGEFCNFRLSIVLPAWSSRFYNEKFRSLTEETIRINLPAHIYPHFYWLRFKRMSSFENLYQSWLQTKCNHEDNNKAEKPAKNLREFLIQLMEESGYNI